MKKTFALVLAVLLAFTLFSCEESIETTKLIINGKEELVELNSVYEFTETKENHRLELKLNGEMTDERKFVISGETRIDYRWIREYKITIDGKEQKVEDTRFVIPGKPGYYSDHVLVGEEKHNVGDVLELESDITISYVGSEKGTEGLVFDENGVLTGFKGAKVPARLVIPDVTSDGVPVTAIGSSVFSYRLPGVKVILIPDTVTSIGEKAFENGYEVEELELPDNLKSIGREAFFKFAMLPSLELPKGLEKIGTKAFQNAKSITTVTVPDTVTWMGSSVFEGCVKLKTAELPASMETLPEGIFYNCTEFESFTGPTSLKVVGSSAMYGTSVKDLAWLGDDVTRLGTSSFHGCGKLEDLTIPGNIKEIGDGAFSECSELKSVRIPASVEKFGTNPFRGDKKLGNIEVAAENANYKVKDGCLVTRDGKTLVSGLSNGIIPADIETIGDSAFGGMFTDVTEVTLPSSLRQIGPFAFRDNSCLEKINYDDGLIEIGKHAFNLCNITGEVVLPGKLEVIGDAAFANNNNLTRLTIPASIRQITTPFWSKMDNLVVVIDKTKAWCDENLDSCWNEGNVVEYKGEPAPATT